VSLHASNTQLRARLVPIERKYPMPELFDALRAFDAAGGRRITFEYVMLDEINDAPSHAAELAEAVRPFRAHVNLIPYNAFPGAPWKPSTPARLKAFLDVLLDAGVPATIREPRGRDIAAACGQLRAEHATKPPRAVLPLLRETEAA
jgi:23S rRNA (adenine2503-C2)-methyltransferase